MANKENKIPNLFDIPEKRPTFEKSFDNTRAFLAELTLPIELKRFVPPLNKNDRIENLIRRMEISSRYVSEYTESARIVAKRFNSNHRERVRQIFKRSIYLLWLNAPNNIKQKYPLEFLDFDKRKSKIFGVSNEIINAIEDGFSTEELNLKFGTQKIVNTRQKLKRFGVEIPYIKRVVEKFSDLGNVNVSDDRIKDLISKVDHSKYNLLVKTGIVINLTSIVKKAGLHPQFTDIAKIFNYLERNGICLGSFPHHRRDKEKNLVLIGYYHFIAGAHEQKVIEYLKAADELDPIRKSRVIQRFGPPSDLRPNTYELVESGNYQTIGRLILEIRGKMLGNKSRIIVEDLLKNSPVPILDTVDHHSFFYPVDKKEEMKVFLTYRLRESALF